VSRMRFDPLLDKNTNKESVCGVVNHSLRPAVSKGASPPQRGFIHGRNFLNIIVALDGHARVYGFELASFLPVLALFDFETAFPSLAQRWLFIVLRTIGMLPGPINSCLGSTRWSRRSLVRSVVPCARYSTLTRKFSKVAPCRAAIRAFA